MQAEIIAIGDEILVGQTADTNSSWIAGKLNELGIRVLQVTAVSDDSAHIIRVLAEASTRSQLVILTGGLGPTSDDITKQTLCHFFGTGLVLNEEVLHAIKERMKKRGFHMNEPNRRQALVPENCILLPNSLGTAPGMWFSHEGTVILSLPGVPYEMKNIMEGEVIPRLKNLPGVPEVLHLTTQTFGTFEAHLAELLRDFEESLPPHVKLAYLPSAGVIRLRLSAYASDSGNGRNELEMLRNNLKTLVSPYVFGRDNDSLPEVAGRLLLQRNATLSTAESCTGGYLAHLITSVPGSSRYFTGSVVAYDNLVKTQILGVNPDDIEKYGAVSREVAVQMAEGVRKKLETTYALAATGIAGPDGGTPEKPVGTTWIALAGQGENITAAYRFADQRIRNIHRASLTALYMLFRSLTQDNTE